MNRWRPGVVHVLLVVAVLALAVVLRIYLLRPTLIIAVHQGVEGGPMKKVAKRFCDSYRGKVEIIELDYDQLYEAEWSAVTGTPSRFTSTLPRQFDVIMLDDPWLPAFVGHGGRDSKVLALDAKRLAGPPGVHDFPQPIQDICQTNGTYYAMPFTGNSQLFCRVRDRRSPVRQPVGWDDVAAMPDQKDRLAYAMRLRPGNSIVTDFLPILWAYAPGSFQDDYTRLDLARAAQGFRMFHKLAQPQHWASAVTQDVDVAVSLALGSAETGVVWNAWAMALERLKDQNPAFDFDFEFGSFRDPKQKPLLGAWLLAVPRNAQNPEEAMEFIEFAIDAQQLELAARFGNPPPRISVLQKHPETPYPEILNSLSHARPRPRTPCWRDVEQTLSKALSNWQEDRSGQVLATLQSDLAAIHTRESRGGCASR